MSLVVKKVQIAGTTKPSPQIRNGMYTIICRY